MGVKVATVRIRTSPAGSRSGTAGFTLFELLVVLLIMGLMATIAAPYFGRLAPRLEAKATARQVVSLLRSARGEAIRDNREVAVVVDLDDRTLRIGSGRGMTVDEGLGLQLLTGTAELIDDGSGRIRFYPDGTSTGGRVTISDPGSDPGSDPESDSGRDFNVRIDWLTGRVAVDG